MCIRDSFITGRGDSICYEGKNSHGRITPLKNRSLYSFYFWVEKDGKYDEFKYDKRPEMEKVYLSTLDKLYI